jgi:hypothetical protein
MNFTYTEQSSDYTFGIYNSIYTNVYYTDINFHTFLITLLLSAKADNMYEVP